LDLFLKSNISSEKFRIKAFSKVNSSSKDQMMESHIQTFLFKMKIFMRVGTTSHGLKAQIIKSSDFIDSAERLKDHAILMRFN
jgi:hypothetical protein